LQARHRGSALVRRSALPDVTCSDSAKKEKKETCLNIVFLFELLQKIPLSVNILPEVNAIFDHI